MEPHCKRLIQQLSLFLLLVILISCHSPINFENEKKTILLLDEQAREHHFKKDAAALVKNLSKNFLAINKGTISQPAIDESYQQFDRYFKSVEFVKWDNVKEPVVRFSDDASLAYVCIDKLVILKLKDEHEKLDTTHFAWLSVYRKSKGEWKLDCIASTHQ